MKSQNTKSSDELKKEVRHELRNVRRDIDELQGRLSPGQIIDDAIFYSHGRNLGATYDHLKNNPIGTTFLSLGTILLMEDESHQTMEKNARLKMTSVKGSIQTAGDRAKEKVAGLKTNVQSKVGEIKHDLQSKQEELKSKVQSRVGALKEEVKFKAGEVKEDLEAKREEARGGIKDRVSGALETGKDRVKNLDPMSFMALGAGLGALTGASLPVSDAERHFVEEKIGSKFSGLNHDLQEAINEVSNVLKDLVVQDVKNYNFKVFK